MRFRLSMVNSIITCNNAKEKQRMKVIKTGVLAKIRSELKSELYQQYPSEAGS